MKKIVLTTMVLSFSYIAASEPGPKDHVLYESNSTSVVGSKPEPHAAQVDVAVVTKKSPAAIVKEVPKQVVQQPQRLARHIRKMKF